MKFHWTQGENAQISHVTIVGSGASGDVHKVTPTHTFPSPLLQPAVTQYLIFLDVQYANQAGWSSLSFMEMLISCYSSSHGR